MGNTNTKTHTSKQTEKSLFILGILHAVHAVQIYIFTFMNRRKSIRGTLGTLGTLTIRAAPDLSPVL